MKRQPPGGRHIEPREMLVPDRDFGYLLGEHLVRYRFAKQFAPGEAALDIGCGSGYGTRLLAQDFSRSTGGDFSSETVHYAHQRYGASNTAFVVMDACHLPFRSEIFDLICAFEVIEHVQDCRGLLQEARRLLRDDGVLLVSTPNSKGCHAGNPYHVREFEGEEFKALLEESFSSVRLFGETRRVSLLYRILKALDIFNLREFLGEKTRSSIVKGLKTTPFEGVTEKDFDILEGYMKGHDFIGVCRK